MVVKFPLGTKTTVLYGKMRVPEVWWLFSPYSVSYLNRLSPLAESFGSKCIPFLLSVRNTWAKNHRDFPKNGFLTYRYISNSSLLQIPLPCLVFCPKFPFWFGFWGALFPRTADPIFHESLCLHPPTAELCPKTLHLDLVNPIWPEGDSIQVLPAVSFWKRERYRLSYQGRASSTPIITVVPFQILPPPCYAHVLWSPHGWFQLCVYMYSSSGMNFTKLTL